MKIKVGLIGSHYMVDRMLNIVREFPVLEHVLPLPFQSEAETVELFQENMNRLDIAVFSGPVPYILAKDLLAESKMPYFVVPYDESTVMSTLIYLSYHRGNQLGRLSFDLPDERNVFDVFSELKIPLHDIYTLDYQKEFDVDVLLRFHQALWEQGKIDYALTSRNNVFDELVCRNIPCIRMVPLYKSIRETMKLVLLKCETLLLDLARFAVINIGINLFNYRSNINHEEITTKIYQSMLGFAKVIGGSITQKSGYVSIYTDRKKLGEITNDFTFFPFLDKLKEDIRIQLSIGLGLGWTNHDAESHAMIALQEAYAQKESAIFIVNENKEIKNLVNTKINFMLKTTEKKLLEIAEKTNLSIKTLSKIKNYWIMQDKKCTSSEELANGLNISRRLSQKILKTLADNHYAVIVGEEQPHYKGRPRPLYELHF
ncbi:hypothetical protein [Ferviditalea candida]|uniref:Transcriptional regulator n=1 Tax=Ferviditalea candida TaxID=3108399 RepID=A0ABU5ZH73_9BACL|nr:hypothetical protein [Paenibacillaceae bacterium T2]